MTIPDLAVWAVEVTERREEEHRGMTLDLKAAQQHLRHAEQLAAERRKELQRAVLHARQSRSLADIARELGVSKQRVQQISEGK